MKASPFTYNAWPRAWYAGGAGLAMVRIWEEGGCTKGERSGKVGGQSPGHTKTWMQAEKPALPSGPMGEGLGGGGEVWNNLPLRGLPGLPAKEAGLGRQRWEAGPHVEQGVGGRYFCFPARGSRACGPPCSLQRLELPGNTSGHRPSLAVAETERQRPPINREIQVSKQPSGSLATGAEVGQCPQWVAARAARPASSPSFLHPRREGN